MRSVYLSTGRYEDAEERETYGAELKQTAEIIRSKRPVVFDPEEIVRLEEQYKAVTSIPSTAVWGAVLQLFLPALLMLGGMWMIIALFRHFR